RPLHSALWLCGSSFGTRRLRDLPQPESPSKYLGLNISSVGARHAAPPLGEIACLCLAQLTISRNRNHNPASGKNHGFVLYKPSGAPLNGISANGLSIFAPAPDEICSAIFCPSNVAIATPCPA